MDLTWWPPNDGFDGAPKNITLSKGTLVDRYGRSSGKYVAPKGTLYGARALAPHTDKSVYYIYKVIKPIVVKSGKAVPLFGEPGGGIQYEFSRKISELIDDEYLEKVEGK